jgi:WD40 repeat protein
MGWLGSSSLLEISVCGAWPSRTYMIVDAGASQTLWHLTSDHLRNAVGSPDSTKIALWWHADSGPNHVQIVDSRTGVEVCRTQAPSSDSIAWSPDSRCIFLGGYTVSGCFHSETGRLVWQASHGHTDDNLLCPSPDGARVVCKDGDRGFVVRDASSGKELFRRAIAHPVGLKSLAWTKDSLSFVTSAVDSSIRVWDAATGDWLAELRYPETRYTHWIASALRAPTLLFPPSRGLVPVWQVDRLR